MSKRKEIVVGIIDGDTFKTDRGSKIRLADVNAPEKGQRGAPKAREELAKLVLDKEVSIEPVAKSYDREVAKVTVSNRSVNKAMRDKGYT